MAIPQFFEIAQQVNKGFYIDIVGYADTLGSESKNHKLSQECIDPVFLFPSRSEGVDDRSTGRGVLSCEILPTLNCCPAF